MPSERDPLTQAFGFTDREALFDRISHARLLALLTDEQTSVLSAEVSSNRYGEFFFLTLVRTLAEQPQAATFFGLGFHEHRERWIVDEWFWYHYHLHAGEHQQGIPNGEVLAIVQERHAEVAAHTAGAAPQSQRGQLFEMLADLTDEDGALSDIEDLEDWDLLDDE